MSSFATFQETFTQFLSELRSTFPEYAASLLLAESVPDVAERFVEIWKEYTTDVAVQNVGIFEGTGVELVPGFVMTTALWNELSGGTKSAIWKYISSLLLLAAQKKDNGFWEMPDFKGDMAKMIKMLKLGGTMGDMEGLFEKLGNMASEFGFKDMSGASKFKLPERLFKGHIARIAEELVKEFKPEDFGISPDMLKSEDPRAVFEFLQEIFTQKPEMLVNVAQKIANKIKVKFQRGEIKREDIVLEAEELMKEFSENTAFSDLFGNLAEALKGGEKASGSEGSTRRREATERLRKKAAEKAAKKSVKPAENAMFTSADLARAAAAAESLLMEEDAAAAKKAMKGGKGK